MGHITITKGVNLPIKGKPEGIPHPLQLSGESFPLEIPTLAALDLFPFHFIKFKLLVKEGDNVKIGEPLAEDKNCPGRNFVSPASGTVKKIHSGLKGRPLYISIETENIRNTFIFNLLTLKMQTENS